jgi:hypothetical protein
MIYEVIKEILEEAQLSEEDAMKVKKAISSRIYNVCSTGEINAAYADQLGEIVSECGPPRALEAFTRNLIKRGIVKVIVARNIDSNHYGFQYSMLMLQPKNSAKEKQDATKD